MHREMPPAEEEKNWQEQFDRRLEKVQESGPFSTAFLDPRRLELAEAVLRERPGLSYSVYGGYPGAERNALQVYPSSQVGSLPPVTAVMVSWPDGGQEPGHRDLLGAIMALGLRRDQVGDIVTLQDGNAVVMVLKPLAEFITSNLDRVGTLQVSCATAEPESLHLASGEGKEIRGTVASLRLDSLLSLGFGLSRSKVVRLIKAGLVMVNWRPVNSPSTQLKENDLLSLRGRGRLVLEAVEGETRKGRMRLKMKKYS